MVRAPLLIVACALVACACGASPPAEEGAAAPQGEVMLEPAEPVDGVEVEPSGRTLSGVYAEDPPRPPAAASTWEFTASGGFSRSSQVGGGVDRDAGSYTIDKSGRLVLYVEQRGDARYTTAERHVYELDGDPASVVTVRSPEGWAARLVRTAAEPASGDATRAAK
jgi:hypothetical protein